MRLKKITLNNFRCFESLEVDLHPRLTVLVGENGAGKTTVLDGIATALSQVLTYQSSANQRLSGRGIEDADFRLEATDIKGGKTRWKLADHSQVIAETVDGLQWDYWRPSSSAASPPKLKYGLSDLKKYLTTIFESYSTETPALTPVFAYYGTRRGDIEVPERLRESKENYDFPTSALIGALDSKNDFKEFLKWFDREEASELRANKGVTNDDYTPSALLDALRTTVLTLLGGSYGNPYFNEKHKFVVEPKGGGAPLLVTQLSQGYQSMLALGMDFARRLALANRHMDYGKQGSVAAAIEELTNLGWPRDAIDDLPESAPLIAPAIMLVDEIDLHLHPSWQQRVLHDLIRAFPATQFIVTTHSPQVLTTIKSECIRILRDNQTYSAPPGTEGAEPGRMLKQVLGLREVRPPTNPATQELKEYLALVDNDQWNSPRAMELREKLNIRYQGNEPALLEADLRIENRKWELGE